MSRDLIWAADMLRFASRIHEVVSALTEDQFLRDWRLQGTVLHNMTVLGEAARRISPEFRAAQPQIEWSGIVGVRNRIVHTYDEFDLDVVWTIATTEVPVLIEQLKAIVPTEPNGEES